MGGAGAPPILFSRSVAMKFKLKRLAGYLASPDLHKAVLRTCVVVALVVALGSLNHVFAQGSVFTGNPAAPLNSGRTLLIIARYVAAIAGVCFFLYGLMTFNSGGWKTMAIGVCLLTYEGWQALGTLIGRGESAPIPGLNF